MLSIKLSVRSTSTSHIEAAIKNHGGRVGSGLTQQRTLLTYDFTPAMLP